MNLYDCLPFTEAPTGQLPCMEIEIDGKRVWLGQSMAMARYIAHEHGKSKTSYRQIIVYSLDKHYVEPFYSITVTTNKALEQESVCRVQS